MKMIRSFLITAAIMLGAMLLPLSAPAQGDGTAINGDEEYKVFIAVLFPNEPDIPDDIKDDKQRRENYLSLRPRLNGIGQNSSYLVIDEETVRESIPLKKGGESALVKDFNIKNKESGRLVPGNFMALLPKDKRIEILTKEKRDKLFDRDAEIRNGWNEFRRSYPFAGGILHFSRAGFNEQRNRAVVFVSMQADYRIGVGYLVYLEKSAITGKWFITGAQLAYMS